MDRFPVAIAGDGDVTVDTGTVVSGPPIGTNTTGQEAEGPHCVGAARSTDAGDSPRRRSRGSLFVDHRGRAGSSTLVAQRRRGARASSAPRSSSRANRKPYLDDEELEGRRLERVLSSSAC